MNCTFHSDKLATHWRKGLSGQRLYMCHECTHSARDLLSMKVYKLKLICPCCGSDNMGGVPHVSVICWNCHALMVQVSDTIRMTNCTCGKHDDGKLIKT